MTKEHDDEWDSGFIYLEKILKILYTELTKDTPTEKKVVEE